MDKRIIMIAALAFAAVACGDDDDDNGDGGIVFRPDSSIPNPTLDSGIDATVSQPDATVQSDASTNVKGAPNCFSGTPTTSVQLLNACAEGYREFDNKTRIQNYVEGPLPAL